MDLSWHSALVSVHLHRASVILQALVLSFLPLLGKWKQKYYWCCLQLNGGKRVPCEAPLFLTVLVAATERNQITFLSNILVSRKNFRYYVKLNENELVE